MPRFFHTDAAVVPLVPAANQAPAANNAAVCTLAAPSGNNAWNIGAIHWSYNATPSNGSLTIAWTDKGTGNNQTETYYITAGGINSMNYRRQYQAGNNGGVTITLAAGGASCSGSVYVDAWQETLNQ